MPNAPWSSPAAPNPATARPTMKAGDEGAVAQTTDPTVGVNELIVSTVLEIGNSSSKPNSSALRRNNRKPHTLKNHDHN